MAVSIVILVAGFFVHVVTPHVDDALGRVLGAYAEQLAAQSPDREAAAAAARRLGITISHEGPDGSWAIGPNGPIPPPAPARDDWWASASHVVKAQDGGAYAFSWDVGVPLEAAHDRLLLLLLGLIVAVLLVGHEVLRRGLRPVRLLAEGADRIGAGDFDIEIPRQSQDELGALTEAFNQMARRVKEMLAWRDQLLLDVSHELRSPLTRMKVALALLAEGDERGRLEADVVQMETMVSSILELERLSDARGLHVERVDLSATAREVSEQLRDVPPGVEGTLPKEPVFVEADAERLRTLLRNLLENAAKYSLGDSRPTEFVLHANDDEVTLTIRDHGQGVSEEDLPVIFEPFRRADRSRSKKTGGFGLGLSICRRIVEAHGGQIRAEHSPERGLTMIVTLPTHLGSDPGGAQPTGE